MTKLGDPYLVLFCFSFTFCFLPSLQDHTHKLCPAEQQYIVKKKKKKNQGKKMRRLANSGWESGLFTEVRRSNEQKNAFQALRLSRLRILPLCLLVANFLSPTAAIMVPNSQCSQRIAGTSKCRFPFENSDMVKTVECVALATGMMPAYVSFQVPSTHTGAMSSLHSGERPSNKV